MVEEPVKKGVRKNIDSILKVLSVHLIGRILTTSENEKLLLMNGIECLGVVMTSWRIIAVIVFICLVSAPFGTMIEFDEGSEQDVSHDEDIPEGVQHNLALMKGWFTENQGQIENSDVKYVYGASDLSIGFIESGYLIKLTNEENLTSVVKVTFEGANSVVPGGRGELPHKSNYFRGNDSSKWRSDVRNYQKVVYEKLYDGIDLVFYTNREGVKYDLIVYLGGDPNDILFSYEGQDDLFTDIQGNLHIECSSGELIENAPYCYQMEDKNNEMVKVTSWYAIEKNIVSFNIEKYDPTLPLIIDPLIFSTFIGGSSDDYGVDITRDPENNIYVAGSTASSDFPTTAGCYDDSYNGVDRDIVVVKLSPDGSELLLSTFVGGTLTDHSDGITLDPENNIYVAGDSSSLDFPTTSGCYDRIHNGYRDAIVFKLNSDGSDLIYSTFVGGIETDYESRIILDPENNAYVSGITNSPDFPTTPGCYDDTHNGGNDVFVFKLNSDGSDLDYSTFVGGSDDEWFDGSLTLNSQNNAYVTGATSSNDFPTTNGCYDETYNGGDTDVFAFKLNSEGSDLIFSTFIGGNNWDRGWRIALDSGENAYITGWTFSPNFPTTPGSYDDSFNGSEDIFICKFNQDGSELLISTFLGGISEEWHSQIALDSKDNVYISSSVFDRDPQDFPTTPGCYDDSHNGAWDVVVCKLSSDLSKLFYSTFIGGSQWDYGKSLSIISEDSVYVTGFTDSSDFPSTGGSYDETHNSENDIFVLRLDLDVVIYDDEIDPGVDDDEWYEEPVYIGGLTALIIVVVIVVVLLFIRKRNAEYYEDFGDDDDSDEEW